MVRRGYDPQQRQQARDQECRDLTGDGRIAHEQASVSGQRYNAEFASCPNDEEAHLPDGLLKRMAQQTVQLTRREIAKSGPPSSEGAE
ncbi:hypothetical protein DLM46_09190 [Paraburkholderia lacunae]|uniref:Uncharacterized protein n=1 Tax=Paraburkholderia lacunae TaxID=2211104 RepID=A0A370NBU1_9BURK|nr:hypothetical protein DLM46_09190 [Paraburkholderia lacunae]